MNGDGKTQIVQLFNNGGQLGMNVYAPNANGAYTFAWGNNNLGEGSGNLRFVPVTMNGDGKTQIVQLFNNGGQLGMIVYAPNTNGSYSFAWGSGEMGEGSGNLGFVPVTMNGDGKTQIAQVWTP
jgi:hypothetical protein